MQNYIGKRIKKIREKRDISQEQLAEKANLSVPSISRLENGKAMVSLEKLIEIAEALDSNLSLILWDYIEPVNQQTIDETQLLDQYRRLSDENKNNIQDLISAMIKNSKK